MKRPLVAVVAGYAIGLLLAEVFQPPLGVLFGCAFVVFILALILRKFRPWLLWLLVALAGWANLASRTAIVSPNDLRALLGDTNTIVAVRGTLTETPHLRIGEHDGQQTERSIAQVRVGALHRGTDWQAADGLIIVTTPGILAGEFFAGNRLKPTVSSAGRRCRWPRDFLITAIISKRAVFFTSSKPVPPTTGGWAHRH